MTTKMNQKTSAQAKSPAVEAAAPSRATAKKPATKVEPESMYSGFTPPKPPTKPKK